MDRKLTLVVWAGILVSLAGLVAAVISFVSYGADNMLTVIFMGVFIIGLVISGVAWSQ